MQKVLIFDADVAFEERATMFGNQSKETIVLLLI
jgi:hypothetical protein